MDSLSLLVLAGVAFVVIFLSSFIARILKAKRHQPYWMLIPWVLAFVAYVTANIFQLDGLFAIAAGMVVFILSIEVIMGMNFTTAVTVSIASFAILTMVSAGSLYGLQRAGTKIEPITNTALTLIPSSEYYDFSFLEKNEMDEETDLLVDDLMLGYTDLDLLPNKVIKRPFIESRVYREINPLNAGSMIGASIRLHKTDGTVLKGNIVSFKGHKLTISRYVTTKGSIKAPIALSSIKKLEVMGR